MNGLRVCLVSYEFPPYPGGEGSYTRDLMNSLKSQGVTVTLVSPDWTNQHPRSNDKSIESSIHVNPIKLPGLKTTSFMIRANRKVRKMVTNFDIVHYTNDYCGFSLSRSQLGIPVFATIHHTHALEFASTAEFAKQKKGLFSRLRYLISQKALARLERSTLEKADIVVAVSDYTAKNAIDLYPSIKERTHVVLNSVDDRRFSPEIDGSGFRSKFGLGSDPTALYVGRFARSKGIEYLIESFKSVVKKIPNAKLMLVGSGTRETEESIKSLVHDLGLSSSIILAGKINDEDLPTVYASSDVLVLPSLVEGFGLVLLEAMAVGKPVVSTLVGPIPELISDGEQGLLVPRGDSNALASAILTVLEDRSLAKKMGEKGRQRVLESFTFEKLASQMTTLYESQLMKRSS